MACGKTPFFSENRNAMFKNICDAEIKYPNNVFLSKECRDLIA
jgi:serum/glucocorticoid-regulated kinase 2